MSESFSPFTKQQLLPQEETLEILRHKRQLFIGVPRETTYQENRICLTPDAVSALVNNGHEVIIESGAGNAAKYSDNDYSKAGAEISSDKAKVFSCPMVLKVEPPSLEQIELLSPQAILISALQIKTQNKKYFEALASKRVTALAFEFIKDFDGNYPAVRSLSEIAGAASILIASELLTKNRDSSGLMLGNITGVPPIEVVVLGAGTVGEYATKSAIGLGTGIKVFDNSLTKLRRLQNNIGRSIFTSTVQPKNLLKALKRCDVVIGAVKGDNRAPIVISEEMVQQMKKGAVIIDVSIDTGGCFETSEVTTHKNPTFVKHGVIHYCVPNIPARYPRTASISLSNIFTPYLLKIAEDGGVENSLRFDKGLKNGLYFYHGILTNKAVGDWFGLKHSDINLLIF